MVDVLNFLKKIFLFLLLIIFVVLLFFYICFRLESWFGWASWSLSGANPYSVKGPVENIYEYKGRDFGLQGISLEMDSSSVVLYSVFDKDTLEKIRLNDNVYYAKYYPTPTGRNYIYFFSENDVVLYEGVFKNSIFLSGLVMLLNVFLFCMLVLAVFFLKKFLLGVKNGSDY